MLEIDVNITMVVKFSRESNTLITVAVLSTLSKWLCLFRFDKIKKSRIGNFSDYSKIIYLFI